MLCSSAPFGWMFILSCWSSMVNIAVSVFGQIYWICTRMRIFRNMFRNLEIIWTSLKMALQEFRSNKLRTGLSLLGIIIGIVCIISVLSTISSMQLAVKDDLKSLGNKSIYIDKWLWAGGENYPWWKYVKRPYPKYEEMVLLKEKLPNTTRICYELQIEDNVEFGDNSL